MACQEELPVFCMPLECVVIDSGRCTAHVLLKISFVPLTNCKRYLYVSSQWSYFNQVIQQCFAGIRIDQLKGFGLSQDLDRRASNCEPRLPP